MGKPYKGVCLMNYILGELLYNFIIKLSISFIMLEYIN